jgi:hypothetical protein
MNDKDRHEDKRDEQDKKDDPHASNLLEDKKPGFKTPEVPSLSEVGSINEQADRYYKAPEDTGEGAPTAIAIEPEVIPPGEVRKGPGEGPAAGEEQADRMRREMKEGQEKGQRHEQARQAGADPDELEEQIEEAKDEDEIKPLHRGRPTTTTPSKRK